MESKKIPLDLPDIGNVVLIGKAWFQIQGNQPEEKIHYLVYKQEGPRKEPGFTGVCLEFGLFSWSDSLEPAEAEICAISESYLRKLLPSNEGRIQIYLDRGDTQFEGFWAIYRQLLFLLGDPEEQRYEELRSALREKHEAYASLMVDMDILQRKYAERVSS